MTGKLLHTAILLFLSTGSIAGQSPFDTIRALRLENIDLKEQQRNERRVASDSLRWARARIEELEAIEQKNKEEKEELEWLYQRLLIYTADLEERLDDERLVSSSRKVALDHQALSLQRQQSRSSSFRQKYMLECSDLDVVVKGDKILAEKTAELSARKMQAIHLKVCYAREYEEGDQLQRSIPAHFKMEKLVPGGTVVVDERGFDIYPVELLEHIIYYESRVEHVEKKELANFGDGVYNFTFTVEGEIVKKGQFIIGPRDKVAP